MLKFYCQLCQEPKSYNPKEYGGYCPEEKGHLCKYHLLGYMEIKTRQTQEMTNWLNSQKPKIKNESVEE